VYNNAKSRMVQNYKVPKTGTMMNGENEVAAKAVKLKQVMKT
jgi:hypothetical protein